MPLNRPVPEPTIVRLALYLRCLRMARLEGIEMLSSAAIEKSTSINSGQVRKDLSYFGEFGKPGIGYAVSPLINHLTRILRLEGRQKVLLVGAGNLGTALAGHTGFKENDFQLAAIYDNNFSKIGRRIWDMEILDMERMSEINVDMRVRIGIIATPGSSAQYVADCMVASGVQVILNFAPARVTVPPGVTIRHMDLTQQLQILCYYLPDEE